MLAAEVDAELHGRSRGIAADDGAFKLIAERGAGRAPAGIAPLLPTRGGGLPLRIGERHFHGAVNFGVTVEVADHAIVITVPGRIGTVREQARGSVDVAHGVVDKRKQIGVVGFSRVGIDEIARGDVVIRGVAGAGVGVEMLKRNVVVVDVAVAIEIGETRGFCCCCRGGDAEIEAVGVEWVVCRKESAQRCEIRIHGAHVGEVVEIGKHLDRRAFVGAGVGAGDVADDADVFSDLDGDVAIDGIFQGFLHPNIHGDGARNSVGGADAFAMQHNVRGTGVGDDRVGGIPGDAERVRFQRTGGINSNRGNGERIGAGRGENGIRGKRTARVEGTGEIDGDSVVARDAFDIAARPDLRGRRHVRDAALGNDRLAGETELQHEERHAALRGGHGAVDVGFGLLDGHVALRKATMEEASAPNIST